MSLPMNVPRETRPFSPRDAAAVETVAEIALTTEVAPRRPDRRRPPLQPYVPMSYAPERLVLSLVALFLLIAGTAALASSFYAGALADFFYEPAPIPTGWREP